MITFSEAYATHGPDTLAIAEALGITEAKADRLIGRELDEAYERKTEAARLEAERIQNERRERDEAARARAEPARLALVAARKAMNARKRAESRVIRSAVYE